MNQQAREWNERGQTGPQSGTPRSGTNQNGPNQAGTHPNTGSSARTNGTAQGHNGTEPPQADDPAPLQTLVGQALDRYFDDLEGDAPSDLYAMVMKEVEKPLLSRVMAYTEGNQSQAAAVLGINRTTLRKKLRQHELG